MKGKACRWIRKTNLFRGDEYECSACGFRTGKQFKTCPCCGVPMKGSKYDPSWVDEMETIDAIFDD